MKEFYIILLTKYDQLRDDIRYDSHNNGNDINITIRIYYLSEYQNIMCSLISDLKQIITREEKINQTTMSEVFHHTERISREPYSILKHTCVSIQQIHSLEIYYALRILK